MFSNKNGYGRKMAYMQLCAFVFEKHLKCATFATYFLNKIYIELFKLFPDF